MATLIGRSLRAAVAWGTLCGLAVCIPASVVDWRANPAGLFHGSDGTHWAVVLETAWSWFWPVALTVAPLAALGKAWSLWRGHKARPGD